MFYDLQNTLKRCCMTYKILQKDVLWLTKYFKKMFYDLQNTLKRRSMTYKIL
jgi:hypothetical protein